MKDFDQIMETIIKISLSTLKAVKLMINPASEREREYSYLNVKSDTKHLWILTVFT